MRQKYTAVQQLKCLAGQDLGHTHLPLRQNSWSATNLVMLTDVQVGRETTALDLQHCTRVSSIADIGNLD